ncbi:MAG: TIGR04283 family arsenosugar biosynthesis glycosyltransferase [Nitrospiria bacterium]
MMTSVSLIIPVFNEERMLPRFLCNLDGTMIHEIIFVDGGSQDQTMRLLENWKKEKASDPRNRSDKIIVSKCRSRAVQMNEGARQATGQILLFLHADSRLPSDAIPAIQDQLANPSIVGGAFHLQIEASHLFLKMISWMANLRSNYLKLPYGDQGYFVRRTVFEEIGGYPPLPLLEDVAFFRRLRKKGNIILLKERVLTSPRRWHKKGMVYTSFRNILILVLYFTGVSPTRLAKWYNA